MVVYEVGVLIAGGLPVLTRQYHKEIGGDQFSRSGFFAAITSFTEQIFADTSEEIKMKKHIVHIKGIAWGKNKSNSLLYVVSSLDTPAERIKKLLDQLAEEVIKWDYPEDPVDSKKFEALLPIIDKIFASLHQKPSDRAKKLFG
ncbi:MAG: hypothetical protein ACFFDI_23995 [Promethearchaeota archaeon]